MHYSFLSIKRWQQEIIPEYELKDNDNNGEEEILKGLVSTLFANSFSSKKYEKQLKYMVKNDTFFDALRWPK